MRHFVIVGILVIVMAVLTYVGLDAAGFATQMNPVAASAQAQTIDSMWHWEIIAMSFLFALIVAPMAYSLVVFRKRKGDNTDAQHIEGNTALEIGWTVGPLILVVVFAYMGAYSLGEIRRVDPEAVVIKVKAQQFSWTFEYPEYGVVSNELHLPANKQVLLKMESADVIHSFWVPEFRVKQDVVPGRVTEYRITPTLIGSYKVRCAELCGTSHAYMEGAIVVSEEADYDTWIAEQIAIAAAAQTPEGKGQLLTVSKGCVGCHSIDGSPLTGPTWFGLFGSDVKLADGSTITADEAFISQSILDPNATIVEGFPSPSVMPPYVLTEEEIANIIAYLKTLK
ncbi:MAG: cytochrome c oxidase subunit II [Anaerolineales bacterium]|jgi:cytochrome c oxidase subunit 2|uniref:cytochrome c oxidase subunit II n=1 Tax=Candidatus Villigracilis affinis TaxID=3140682 RepID=UPI001D6E10C0|nr:cytochrome c oxidase subunit II [Anaerolineales bacterium]MBK9601189.1 cytochrome c oxidase subunit II [Anaerolineales bacterium]MBL0347606.1 cytochrome c oxidase subunit II [Anaerolineales bacterium]